MNNVKKKIIFAIPLLLLILSSGCSKSSTSHKGNCDGNVCHGLIMTNRWSK